GPFPPGSVPGQPVAPPPGFPPGPVPGQPVAPPPPFGPQVLPGQPAPLPAEIVPNPGPDVYVHWWKEGKHVVIVVGSDPVRKTLDRIDQRRPNLTANPRFQKLAGFHQYESYCRGFVDFQKLQALVPAMLEEPNKLTQLKNQMLVRLMMNQLGINGCQGLSWHWGFEGRYQRSTTVLHVAPPESRQGLLRIVSAPARYDPKAMPPLPTDLNYVSVHHIDWDRYFGCVRDLYKMGRIAERLGAGEN